ncbi:hypothetical protein ACFLRP_00290 [Bacteroidota bacterium]
MPKNKESSFKVKLIIWDIAASASHINYEAIGRQVDSELRGLLEEEGFCEDTPDVRTIKRIIEKDINELNTDVVLDKLPRYMWHLRTDYETIISEASVEKPANVQTNQIDPIVNEARKEHLQDIHREIEQYIKYFTKFNKELPSFGHFFLNLIYWKVYYQNPQYHGISGSPLFESIKEHLPIDNLWNLYSKWCSAFPKYLYDSFKYIKRLERSSKSFLDCELTRQFLYPIVNGLRYRQENHLWPDEISFETRIDTLYVHFEGQEFAILKSDKPDKYNEQYRELYDSYMDNDDFSKLIEARIEIYSFGKELQDIFKQVLLTREYIKFRCNLCP